MKIPIEALEAARRILESENEYGTLRIVGDPKVYERFYKDVQLLAETVAQLVVGEVE